MTRDPCARHEHREATHVAMITTTTGRMVYRLCDPCAAATPAATPLPQRLDLPNTRRRR